MNDRGDLRTPSSTMRQDVKVWHVSRRQICLKIDRTWSKSDTHTGRSAKVEGTNDAEVKDYEGNSGLGTTARINHLQLIRVFFTGLWYLTHICRTLLLPERPAITLPRLFLQD